MSKKGKLVMKNMEVDEFMDIPESLIDALSDETAEPVEVPNPSGLARESLLVTAESTVNSGSEVDPVDRFAVIAELWGAYLGMDILPQDVAALMIMEKIVAVRHIPADWNSWVDMAGFASIGGTVGQEVHEFTAEEIDEDEV